MNNRIKKIISYSGVVLLIISLLLKLGYEVSICGGVIFLVFNFGKKIAEYTFVLLGFFFIMAYLLDSPLFQWEYVVIFLILTIILYFASPFPKPESKKKISSECPRCNGTGKDFLNIEFGRKIEVPCNGVHFKLSHSRKYNLIGRIDFGMKGLKIG